VPHRGADGLRLERESFYPIGGRRRKRLPHWRCRNGATLLVPLAVQYGMIRGCIRRVSVSVARFKEARRDEPLSLYGKC
jgi:hypothetical protein